MGKCVRIPGGKPSPSPAEAAAYLTLRSGRRVPVASCSPRAAGTRHHRRGSAAACRRCGAKAACGGGSPGRRKSAETRPSGGSQLSGGQPEEEVVERPPSEASPVARDDGDGCGDGDDGSFGPTNTLADDTVKAKHGHGSTAGAVAAGHQRLLPPPSPLEAEMEAFFAAAELAERRRFAEAYNYDVALDRPLEGRFEWAPVSS